MLRQRQLTLFMSALFVLRSCSSRHLPTTPVTQAHFSRRLWHIKRDDLLHLASNPIATNGNKLRKFVYLLHLQEPPKVIASHGGMQSNSMVALAVIAQSLQASFHYFVHHLPRHFLSTQSGNYKLALALGMKVHSLEKSDYALVKDTPILSHQAQQMIKVFSVS